MLYAYARLNAGENRFFSAKGWVFYLASVATAILAMRTKEIAFTLPILLSLYEFLFFEGSLRKRSSALAPHILTMLIIPLSILHLGRSAGEIIGELRQATEFQPTVSRYVYLVTQFRVIVTYLRLLVSPSTRTSTMTTRSTPASSPRRYSFLSSCWPRYFCSPYIFTVSVRQFQTGLLHRCSLIAHHGQPILRYA